MANYLVRVAPEYSFTEEHMSGLGDIFNKLADHFGSDICSILISRFTFGVYSIEADSKSECEEMVRAAWTYIHPDFKGISLNIAPYPGTQDEASLMRSIYSGYYGVEDYIKMITELTPAIEIMRDKEALQASDVISQDTKHEKTGYDALSELVRMDNIIKKVREIVSQVKYTINNDKVDRPCIHMRFHGAPGTGKTTVARIIGQIFKEEEILRKGSFLELSQYLNVFSFIPFSRM